METLGPRTKLAELHVHLGASVDPAVMWEIAHAQGIRLPTKDYWKFVDLVTVDSGKKKTFEDYLSLFRWTELIQSSPLAIERSVYQTIAGAYRKNNITLLELRFNPMKRNRGGEQDLDQIMMAAVRGIDRASLEYPVRTGLIVCLDRTFNRRLNEILLEKAIAFSGRGVVGIDMAGPASRGFRYSNYADIYRRARKEGLGLTVHAGEDEGHESVREVLQHLEPDRIGHGVRATEDGKTMEALQKSGVVLEVCPTSNLNTGVLKDVADLKRVFRAFLGGGVKFTLSTDGPEMLKTNLRGEMEFLMKNGALRAAEILEANRTAFAASFVEGR
ncbi:MAG: amidohydrolase family protein [Nitrososphaerota archaeon]|nr:amidohydrolase family protein [Nitrososphaerota archaeon]MDG7023500.1 amidohydrolase family protein [Nitrososphaerota archaeon]